MWDADSSMDSLQIRIPAGLRSKQKLLGIFAKKLHFPAYFGWNWDALEECLRDLTWLPAEQAITVVHESLPFGDTENRRIYLAILAQWKASSPRTVRLMLLPDDTRQFSGF